MLTAPNGTAVVTLNLAITHIAGPLTSFYPTAVTTATAQLLQPVINVTIESYSYTSTSARMSIVVLCASHAIGQRVVAAASHRFTHQLTAALRLLNPVYASAIVTLVSVPSVVLAPPKLADVVNTLLMLAAHTLQPGQSLHFSRAKFGMAVQSQPCASPRTVVWPTARDGTMTSSMCAADGHCTRLIDPTGRSFAAFNTSAAVVMLEHAVLGCDAHTQSKLLTFAFFASNDTFPTAGALATGAATCVSTVIDVKIVGVAS